MPQEKLEIVRAAVAAFNRRDERAWLEFLDPEVEFIDQLTLNPNAYRGHDTVLRWFRGWDKIWEEISASNVEALGERGDVLVFRFTAHGRGRGSGVMVEQDFWTVITVRNGRFVRVESHRSEADALDATGLRESAP